MSSLKRVLTLRTVISTSAGLTFSTACFVAAAQVASYLAGDAAWLAILVAGLLTLLSAAVFSELNGLFPSAAGLRLYMQKAFGEQVSLVISLMYMLVITMVVGTETYVLGHVLNFAMPAVSPIFWVVIMLVVATAMNLRGVNIAGMFQDFFTYGLIAALLVFSVLAFSRTGFHVTAPLATNGAGGLFNAVAVGVFLFVGFEWVTPLAEEVTHDSLIPKGMFWAVGILAVVYGLFTTAMTATVPAALRQTLLASPVPHLIFAQAVLGKTGVWWLTLTSLAASITTFNAGLITISRFMYASAREAVLPKWFSQVNLRFATPQNAIVTLFAVALVVSGAVYFSGRYLTLVLMGSAMESLIYAAGAIAVLVLRRRYPDQARPFRIAGGPVIPIVTALVFAVLALGVMLQNYWVPVLLAATALVIYLYVVSVVPRLKARQAAERQTRSRRRPLAAVTSEAAATGAPAE
ncbi:MAG: APC family permease [Symbiobacteriia bacterium]